MSLLIKGIILAVLAGAVVTTYLAWHHSIYAAGEAEQVARDAPVVSQCKTAFDTKDTKECGARLARFLVDRTKALAENKAFGEKFDAINAAAEKSRKESEAIKAEAVAVLARAEAKNKGTKALLDRYAAILNAPPGPKTATSCEEAHSIIHDLLVRP